MLVVRAEHRAAIPGIVHGSSGSGASLFLEPLSTVEINNDIVALEQQETEEVLRILLALTDAFRGRADDLRPTVDAATELDVLQARARFSHLVDGVEPALARTAGSSCAPHAIRCSFRRCVATVARPGRRRRADAPGDRERRPRQTPSRSRSTSR